ncbi:ABC-type bacteriocin/lantibiotic exporter, contains an N-terminal double-glycine peptidase domain [Ruminococcaceae bacterium YRB3002]|nr:ABC-type bacteriocin/lantibiotic exporter, contains an N-terminal double-glycine peptidase domain [Ruminococcaceae bacterium YRB3002]
MGLYTKVLKERNRLDNDLMRQADQNMMNRVKKNAYSGYSDEAQAAVNYILARFGLAAREIYEYSDAQELLDLMLDPLGVMYDPVDTTNPEWTKRSEYMLGYLDDGTPEGKAVVLKPAIRGYKYYCPVSDTKGKVTASTPLKDTAYAVHRPLKVRSASIMSLAMFMFHLISPRDLVVIGVSTLLVSLLGLVVPRMNQYVLNEIVPMGNSGYALLIRSLLLFLTAGVIKAGITAVKSNCLGKMRIRISSEAQAAVMSRLLLLPQNFFTRSSTGRLSKQISNSRALCDQILNFVMGSSLTAITSIVYIPQMTSFSKILLVPALSVLVVKSLYTFIAGLFYVDNERSHQEAGMEERAFLYTALKGIQRIKESGAEKRIYAKWAGKFHSVLTYELDKPAVLQLEDVVVGFLSSLCTVIMLSLIVPNGISRADYIAFNSSFAIITTAVTELMSAHRKLSVMKPMLDNFRSIIETDTEEKDGQTVIRRLRGDVRLENITFAYEESNYGCLEDISLHVSPGEKVAIVGESGCGKSTLLKIILGSLHPDSGGVFIDNAPLDTLNMRSYRRRIGSVFQFSRLMPGTIYSNIAFCPRVITEEEAQEAAEKAAIADIIEGLPLKYDTEISDSNSGGFSGGQRQRLLLARAFASKPDIMILDEATSALDNIAQSKVLESVYKEKCTVIMVAHRLSTVKGCDRIILLKDGHIAEEGDYDQLMELKGEFYELMRRQE